ncbi:hypothetical protein TNCV_3002601 [Trichonephila clavipes]|nr:hypothetical protein TNCV_3002601 [Trichonephila clavipes]
MLVGLLLRSCFLIGGHGRRQWAGRTGDFGGLRKNQVQIRASRREARLLLVVRSRKDTLSRTQAFELHRHFRDGRGSVEDDKRSGSPQTFRTAEHIEKVSAAVRKNRLQTISESVGISEIIL